MTLVRRGELSHDPDVAAKQHERAAKREAALARAKFRADRAAAIKAEHTRREARRRERGRVWKEVEICYKQYLPAQIRLAKEMQTCG